MLRKLVELVSEYDLHTREKRFLSNCLFREPMFDSGSYYAFCKRDLLVELLNEREIEVVDLVVSLNIPGDGYDENTYSVFAEQLEEMSKNDLEIMVNKSGCPKCGHSLFTRQGKKYTCMECDLSVEVSK